VRNAQAVLANRDLIVGEEYQLRTLHGTQRLEREWRISYLGPGMIPGSLSFNARPAAGTQEIDKASIVAFRALGPGQG
jgi:hypothetical protein